MVNLGGKIKELLSRRKWRVKIKTWMLIVALAPLGFVDATLLRYNHIEMTELRDNVLKIDAEISETESDEDYEKTEAKLKNALVKLKEYTFSNIVINITEENGVQKVAFGTGPFYLEHQYLRAATRALEKAESELTGDSNPNGNVYAEAGEVCREEAIQNGWIWDSPGYINCMLREIQKYPSMDEIQDKIIASLPSTELYRLDYASPIWAPTLTGWMLFITLIVIVVIFIRILTWVILRVSLLFL